MKKLMMLYGAIFHFWMKFPEKIRFVLVGGYNTVFSYVLYAFFIYLFHETYIQVALFLSFLLSSVNSYWSQKIYVFGTKGNYLKEYVRCLLTWGINYAINAILLEILLYLNVDPYLAQVIALFIITINSYIMLKYVAFRKNK